MKEIALTFLQYNPYFDRKRYCRLVWGSYAVDNPILTQFLRTFYCFLLCNNNANNNKFHNTTTKFLLAEVIVLHRHIFFVYVYPEKPNPEVCFLQARRVMLSVTVLNGALIVCSVTVQTTNSEHKGKQVPRNLIHTYVQRNV